MVNWVYVAIVVILVLIIFAFVRFKYIRHKISWIIILALILFFYIAFMASTAGQDVDLKTFDGIKEAGKLYFAWLGNAFENIKTITANAIKMDWQADTS